jgi:biopolymer transport protein ExbD
VATSELQAKMENEVLRDPTNQPELRIDANPDAQYDVMAKVLAAAKNARMQKIGFVQPDQ